jgi:hypothetical protein
MLSQTAGQTSLESRCLFRLSAVLYATGAAVRSGKEFGMKLDATGIWANSQYEIDPL